MKRLGKIVHPQTFLMFLAVAGAVGYVIHFLTGADFRIAFAATAVGMFIAGWISTFVDEP